MLDRLLALAMTALLAVGVTSAQAQEPSRLDEIIERGRIIVGVTSETPPFGFVDEKGELVGFEIDLAKLMAKALFKDETKLELVRQSFSARFPSVQTGKIDFGIQVTTVYPERLLQVAFTRPYIETGTAVLVRKADPLPSLADLNKPEIRAGLITTPQQEERRAKFFPDTQGVTFDGYTAMILALRSNRVDFAQMDLPIANWYVTQNQDLAVLEELISEKSYNAVFLNHGDFKLWLLLDQMIASMRSGPLYSDYAAIHEKWFGVRPERQMMP